MVIFGTAVSHVVKIARNDRNRHKLFDYSGITYKENVGKNRENWFPFLRVGSVSRVLLVYKLIIFIFHFVCGNNFHTLFVQFHYPPRPHEP